MQLLTKHLSVGYKTPILQDINLCIAPGHLTALVGRNGVGKSTLLKTIGGEIPPLEGGVWLDNQPLQSLKPSQRAKAISLVTTERGMASGLTLRQLVSLGRQPYTGFFGHLSSSDHDIVDGMLSRMGIASLSDKLCANLSDGEFQKGMLARALAQDTPIMLLDEPLSHLDVAARIEILAMLREIAVTQHKAILLSTHDVAQAIRMATDIFMATSDREFIVSTPAQLLESANINRLFDVENVEFCPEIQDFIYTAQTL